MTGFGLFGILKQGLKNDRLFHIFIKKTCEYTI